MARLLTETFDPRDFLQMGQQGNAAMSVASNPPLFDFEASMINGITFYPMAILNNTPSEVYGGFFQGTEGVTLITQDLILFYHDSSLLGSIRKNAGNGKLELIVNGNVEAIGTVNYVPTTLYHIQFRYKVSAGAGVFECKLNEDHDVLTFNGATDAGGLTYCNRFVFPAFGERYDSLYINDTSGVEDNGYGGIVRMKSFVPTNDGFWADWLLTSGIDGFAMLNQTPHDGDTTIISTFNNGEKSSFGFPGHGLVVPSEIKAVSARWVVRKVSNGAVRPFFRINGTDYPVAAGSVPVGVGYTCIMDRRTTNPDTTLPWALVDTIDSAGLEAIL